MLRRMIRDGAPPEWTPLMRLVAAEIADDARDPVGDDHEQGNGEHPWSAIPIEGKERRGQWQDGLAERTGMSTRAISRVLAELAAADYEMRQPITGRDGKPIRDKRGRLVFAAKDHALRFQVPGLAPRPVPQSSPNPATYATEPVDNTPTDFAGVAGNPADSAPFSEVSSPNPATCDGQRSPLLVSKVAGFGDPISSVSPQLKPSPHAVVIADPPEVEGGYGGEPGKADFCPDSNPSPDAVKPAERANGNGYERYPGEDEDSYRKRMQDALMDLARQQVTPCA